MQSHQLFEAPIILEVGAEQYLKCTKSEAKKCMCRRCQGKAILRSHPNSETQWLFESPLQSDREVLGEQEFMASLNGGAGWFWQALREAHLALKSAMDHLKNHNIAEARKFLATARHRVNLAGKTLGQLKSQKTLKDALADGHVAIQRAQRHLSTRNADIKLGLAELKKARGAIGAAMREALKARGGNKVWN
jgi:hypothetical protein